MIIHRTANGINNMNTSSFWKKKHICTFTNCANAFKTKEIHLLTITTNCKSVRSLCNCFFRL